MTRAWQAMLACTLLTACPFRSFSVAPAQSGSNGGSGGSNFGTGGVAKGGAAGGQGGTARMAPPPQAFDDEYFMRQGTELHVREPGVLANDAPKQLKVVDCDDVPASRKEGFDMKCAFGADGALDFTPDPRFFGVHQLRYTVQNRDGVKDEAVITVNVAPSSSALDVLTSKVGGVVLSGNLRGDRLGSALSAAGDVDGDGVSDLLVGAPGAAGGSGAAYVVFGRNGLASLELSAEFPDESYAAFVGLTGEGLGLSLAAQAGRASMLLLGAPQDLGRVYRVPFELAVRKTISALGADSEGALVGDDRLAGVGRLLADAGDIDGDGLRDALIACTEGDVGVLRVVYGSESRETQALADAPGRWLAGNPGDDGFPFAIAGAGDQDGDGRAEVLVASGSSILLLDGGGDYPENEAEVSIDGSEYGFRALRAEPGANASVAAIGDLDGDGFQDIAYCDGAVGCRIVKTPPSTLTNGWRVSGFGASATRLMVAPAGDVDADGVPDILFAEDSQVYVVYGRPAGHEDVSVGFLGNAGFRLSMPAGRPVTALAGVGDVNADGIDDIAIGDAGAKVGAGRVYVVFGVASR